MWRCRTVYMFLAGWAVCRMTQGTPQHTAPCLWLSFPEESLSQRQFSPDARSRLEQVFDINIAQSPLRRAMALLGMQPPQTETRMMTWYNGAPYINGNALAWVVSAGSAMPQPQGTNGFLFVTRYTLRNVLRVMAQQWRVTRFVQDRLSGHTPPDADGLTESIALGLCVQVLLMRLDAARIADMPRYLAAPETAPALYRRTFEWLQKLQLRRSDLSSVWHGLFADAPVNLDVEKQSSLPAFFWDHPDMPAPAADAQIPVPDISGTSVFTGLPVCAGRVAGRAIVVQRTADIPPPQPDKPVYIFRHARPETTVYFAQAGAVVFANGGVLSHACVVARDMGVPCVTGLGDEFYAEVKDAGDALRIAVDGASGEVEIIAC